MKEKNNMSKLNDKLTAIEQEIHNLKSTKSLDIETLKDVLLDLEKVKESINEFEIWLKSGINFLE